jgi:hypothetical protein
VAGATLRVLVHVLDQLTHGAFAVAEHLRRVAPRSGDQAIADHQHAEVMSGKVLLDQDRVAEFGGAA